MDILKLLEKAAKYAEEQLMKGAERGGYASSMSDAELMKKIKSGGSSLSSLKEKSMYKAELDKRRKK